MNFVQIFKIKMCLWITNIMVYGVHSKFHSLARLTASCVRVCGVRDQRLEERVRPGSGWWKDKPKKEGEPERFQSDRARNPAAFNIYAACVRLSLSPPGRRPA
jgi:hypothetical protein